MFDFNCPYCRATLAVPNGHSGPAVRCGGCKSLIPIPEIPVTPPQANVPGPQPKRVRRYTNVEIHDDGVPIRSSRRTNSGQSTGCMFWRNGRGCGRSLRLCSKRIKQPRTACVTDSVFGSQLRCDQCRFGDLLPAKFRRHQTWPQQLARHLRFEFAARMGFHRLGCRHGLGLY